MNYYIFLTDEGFTFAPGNDGELQEIENLQVIGFAKGDNANEAYENLLFENSYLKHINFEKVFCYQLNEDYGQSRKDYNLNS